MQFFRSIALAALVGLSATGLSSCNTARYFDFTTSASSAGGYHQAKPQAQPAIASELAAEEAVVAVAEPAPMELTASAAPVVTPAPSASAGVVQQAAPAPARLSEQLASARTERTLTRAQERRYEKVLKRVKAVESQQQATNMAVDIAELILAIIIPPLGVFLHEKGITSKFWISLLLTLLFYFPGMIYSVLVVTDTI